MSAQATASVSLFELEAKIGPNRWVPVNQMHPKGPHTGPFSHHQAALLAKSALKSRLSGKWKNSHPKYPIRVVAVYS
ncbi:MAG: hypothetical protein MI747_15485 [Desulfobacterales bacterium]|nr:hypothetical protein [Desulfobacterales bacterium]